MKKSKTTKRRLSVAEASAGTVIDLVPRVLGVRRLLVPFDFSKPSEKALRYAVSFARQFDAKITLLHVRPLPYYVGEFGDLPIPAEGSSEKAIAERLKAEARRLVPAGMLERAVVRTGSAYDEICKAAHKLKAEMIVISTHGYTGLKHALLGSTAERVVRHAPCPVLVVRQHEREFA
jgi:nucleotide-binding universal stress UspA family protein